MPESLGQALLIANANYSDKTLNALRGTEVDIRALEAVLADPAVGGYKVQTSLDESIHMLRQRIERFFVQAPKDGLLLLYLSGHGVKDRDGRLYFAAADTESNFLMSTGLAATFIQEASERSRCRRQVLIFDACFSGAFARGYLHKSDQKVHTQESFSGGTGKIIITASDDMQYAWVDDEIEGAAAASVFTRHLVQGLRTGAAANDAEIITAERLYQYVRERVKQDNPAQQPQLWSFGLDGGLMLARNPAPKLPADIVELLEDPRPRVRVLGIDEMEKRLLEARLHPAIGVALEKLKDDDSRSVSARAAEVQAALDALQQAAELERQADAEAQRQAEAERKRLADAEVQRQAEAERKRLAEAEAQRQAEAERKRLAEAEAQRQAKAEAQQPTKKKGWDLTPAIFTLVAALLPFFLMNSAKQQDQPAAPKAPETARLETPPKPEPAAPPPPDVAPQTEVNLPDCATRDSDHDGVNDCDDKCSNTAKGMKVDEFGCPIRIELKGVNFKYDSGELTDTAKTILDKVSADLNRYPVKKNIELRGHASSDEGTNVYSLRLSQQRAQTVADYLKSKGVTNKLIAKGYGIDYPIADNNDEAGRAKNRRVELVWTGEY